jgi:hypothetical protein
MTSRRLSLSKARLQGDKKFNRKGEGWSRFSFSYPYF